ncbi:MAG: hypothetical protein ACRD3D_11545 [Terriglobia bacterium]
MRKHLIAIPVAFLAIAFAACAGLAAQSAPESGPLTGTWQCISHGGQNGDLPFTLTLQQNGETVTGSVASSIGNAELGSSTFKNNHLHIVINGENDSYVLEAIYKSGRLKGTWGMNGSQEKGAWEGKKSAQATQ